MTIHFFIDNINILAITFMNNNKASPGIMMHLELWMVAGMSRANFIWGYIVIFSG